MTDQKPTRQSLKQDKPKKKKLFKSILKISFGVIGITLLLGIALFTFYASKAPELTEADLKSGSQSVLYDANNKPFLKIGLINRSYVTSDQIPQTMKDAVVSIEDRRFYKEKFGIDPIRIASAAFSNITGQSSLGLQGGSTLTQQLVKLSVFSTKKSDQTLKRKAQEAWLAMQVERQYSKDQILEFYLNIVYLNNGVYGMGTAAEYYYGKDINNLSLPQIALLAGMPQKPAGYDPYTNPTAAKNRRDLVLNAMVRNNKISASEAQEAIDTPITTGLVAKKADSTSSSTELVTDPYVKQVINDVKKKGYNIYTDGLKIYTNLDLDAQSKLYDLVNNNEDIQFPDDLMQTAVSITNPNNGKIVAMIGGRKQGNVRMGYNRAVQSGRSNGSSMKPLMDYGPAIEYLDQSTYTKINDAPYTYPGTNISLNNIDGRYLGSLTTRMALVYSRNIPAVKTLANVGMTRATEFLNGLGISVPSDAGYSYGIGGNASTLQQAAAYAAFANGGTYYKPYYINKIETSDGLTHSYESTGKRAMSQSTAYMITDMLKDVFTLGTAKYASIPNLYQAGKTGTTDYSAAEIQKSGLPSNYAKDSWFSGYTKDYSIAVWTGYDKPLEHGLDTNDRLYTQLIYKEMMSYLSQNKTNKDWKMPGNVVAKDINGKRELFILGSNIPTIPSSSSSQSSIADDKSSSSSSESESESSSSESSSESSSSESSQSSSSSSQQPSSSSSSSQSSSSQNPPATPQEENAA